MNPYKAIKLLKAKGQMIHAITTEFAKTSIGNAQKVKSGMKSWGNIRKHYKNLVAEYKLHPSPELWAKKELVANILSAINHNDQKMLMQLSEEYDAKYGEFEI